MSTIHTYSVKVTIFDGIFDGIRQFPVLSYHVSVTF
ncbi:Uncharacterised protein [Serratia fonticola]|nr:Uncharacterised protein [Serratia fonticola]